MRTGCPGTSYYIGPDETSYGTTDLPSWGCRQSFREPTLETWIVPAR